MLRLTLAWVLGVSVATAGSQDPVFRSRVDFVTIDVAVHQGTRVVAGLTANDFEVSDNGKVQVLSDVAFESVPIEATLLVDMSGSVEGPLLDAIRRGVRAADEQRRPQDRINLIRFSHQIEEVRLAPGADVGRALVSPGGQTSLFDALAVSLIRPREPDLRQLLILFTDGRDTMSFLDDKAVRAVAERSDVSVFIVAVTDDARVVAHRDVFAELAERTGGRFAVLSRNGNLSRAFVQALDDFRRSYVLRYALAANAQPGWHDVAVRVTRPGRYELRARRGYFASDTSQ